MKRFKRFLTLALPALTALGILSGCGCGGGAENADLVFINDSDAVIAAVVVDFEDGSGGSQHADGSPLERGESFGFEVGQYPVTVSVYDRPFEGVGQRELGRFTIAKAPPEGDRWYVTARDSGSGIVLTADIKWPEGR